MSDLAGNEYSIYRTVINGVLNDSERLPSLPAITLKIRQAINQDCTTPESLAQLIGKDPGLSALLIKAASSPLYTRVVTPKTLVDVVAMLGFGTVNNLVMLHSVRSLYVMRSSQSKKLFSQTWKRLVIKTALATFFAKKLRFHSAEQVQMATLLTEVGSLSVLSAVIGSDASPDQRIYVELCRHYSKSLGTILLKKWNVDSVFIDVIEYSGNWEQTWEEDLCLIDLIHLALYNTVLLTNKNPKLPPLEKLAAYQKIPTPFRRTTKPNMLALVAENKEEIQEIINSLS